MIFLYLYFKLAEAMEWEYYDPAEKALALIALGLVWLLACVEICVTSLLVFYYV